MAEDRIEKLRETVTDLVRKFEANKGAYKATSFLEANLRLEFIDELFEGLGWDVHNKKGLPPSRKELIVERGESGDRPDYNFRIDGVPFLYVETKKPSEDLDKTAHIMQAKTYAWSGKRVKVVGLTDFEEFRLFDATLKPNPRYPDQGEIFRLHYTAYLDNLDKLLLLHRDAVAEGSLDGLLLKDKKSVAQRKPVDKEFLKDLNAWRLMLGKGLYKKSGYTYEDHEISDLVQHLLDRILFIRIAGERDVIEPRQLADKLEYWKESKHKYGLYKDILVPLFREMNRDVDGDLLKPGLVDEAPFDDDDVAELIEELYPPKSIYRFDEMPIELIGAAYEQYLGNVIRCTPKQVKLERKAEVRKAGGVYYTPEYIVDYIVENTVGKLVEGKTPAEVERLKILDPACGSGSFLIGALEYLIDYVAGYYREHPDEVRRDSLFPFLVEDYERGEERLSIERKVRLLENCIYGVDIDSQAVEVTKLSLYLKVLERERRLPRKHALLKSLDKNIKWGNSLIGSDYFEGQLMPDEKERRRVNPFDWKVGFPDIIKAGGFDAVIGNPPYVRMEGFKKDKLYFRANFETHNDRADYYFYFIEKGLSLLKPKGLFGYIVSNSFAKSRTGDKLREHLIKGFAISRVVDFGDFIPFEGPTTYPYVLIVMNEKPTEGFKIGFIDGDLTKHEGFQTGGEIAQKYLKGRLWVFESENNAKLREKLSRIGKAFCELYRSPVMGIKTGLNEAFIITEETKKRITEPKKDYSHILKPYLDGRDLKSWVYGWRRLWLIYTYHGVDISKYPEIEDYLRGFKEKLKNRATQQKWYELQQPQFAFKNVIENPKIIYPDISREPKFCLDDMGVFFSNTTYFINSDDRYLLGLLNSKLIWFVIEGLGAALRGGKWRFRLFTHTIEKLPIRIINANDPADVARHDKMVALVEEMLELHKRLAAARSDADKKMYQKAVDATDRKIDALVYELYGLTDEEINIVES